jgi:V/A-type H+-transporting ATPase subunit E
MELRGRFMALDKVVGNILEIANTEAAARIATAQNERATILQQADQTIANKKKAQEKELEIALKRLRQQEISSAELEAKRIVLNAKKEILDRSFKETLKDLESMSEAEKVRVYEKILTNAKKSISKPKVLCPKGESHLVQKDSEIASVTETDMSVGLILESQDGTIRLDYRFNTMLGAVWEKELKNVSNALFG